MIRERFTSSTWATLPAASGHLPTRDGDVERLQYATISLDYPAQTSALFEVIASMTGADIWIGAVAIWGRMRL